MAEAVGGYDYKYITEVPEDLVCSICHFPFKDPIHIEECGHIYCKECFEQTKDRARANALDFCCPLDQQKVDVIRVFKDKFIERKVLSLKVECRNLANGCSWTGDLRDAIDHQINCDYVAQPCPNQGCNKKILKKDPIQHNEVCSFKKIQCSYCQTGILRLNQEQHDLECLNEQVNCV